jgi:hypothetical protein
MRKCDWTDYRQALQDNEFKPDVAVQSLRERGFSLNDIDEARKEFDARANNPLIEKAMMEENSSYTKGNPVNQKILKDNSNALAAVIRAGIKK